MKKVAVVAIFLGLIGLNILTLVNSAVYNAIYGVLDNMIPASWMAESRVLGAIALKSSPAGL